MCVCLSLSLSTHPLTNPCRVPSVCARRRHHTHSLPTRPLSALPRPRQVGDVVLSVGRRRRVVVVGGRLCRPSPRRCRNVRERERERAVACCACGVGGAACYTPGGMGWSGGLPPRCLTRTRRRPHTRRRHTLPCLCLSFSVLHPPPSVCRPLTNPCRVPCAVRLYPPSSPHALPPHSPAVRPPTVLVKSVRRPSPLP